MPVIALAPSNQHSGQSHAITLNRPLNVSSVHDGDFFGFTIDGTPCDCIKLGIKVLCNEKPLLVVSGVNDGPNVGRSIFYSGTVGAALEAAIEGFPAIAVSQDQAGEVFDDSAAFAADLAYACLRQHELRGYVLNVNTPASPKHEWLETEFLGHGLSGFEEQYQAIRESGDRITWRLSGTRIEYSHEGRTDAHALRDGHPVISMLHPDFNVRQVDTLKPLQQRVHAATRRWHQSHAHRGQKNS
jgi:5'-nucleotidase